MWVPILEGDSKREAIDAVQAIARDLKADQESMTDVSLSGGKAGMAVLYAYLSEAYPDTYPLSDATSLLEECLSALENVPMTPALHGGFTGIAWTSAHMERLRRQEDHGPDSLETIDDALLEALVPNDWPGMYDLIGGLVGFGLYALERLPRSGAEAVVRRIAEQLEGLSETTESGITWFTRPELLQETTRVESPYGSYNLGLAHGVPGVIGFLGSAASCGIANERTYRLLDGAVRWLLANRMAEGSPSCFARCIGPSVEPSPARLAWCYGDPGIACALAVAAQGAGRSDWLQAAADVARRAAVRTLESSGVHDASICHGAAGIAHMFNRLYQATGDALLRDAARRWIGHTLGMRRAGEGVGGFAARIFGADKTHGWEADPGMLNGAAGVALVLLAAVMPIPPQWDRMFLLSPSGGSLLKGGEPVGKQEETYPS